MSGSICLFLSRKLFENKPSTSDLGEFFKIDLRSLGQPLTVGVRDHSLADRVPNISERGGKTIRRKTAQIHKIVRQHQMNWLTSDNAVSNSRDEVSNFQIGANKYKELQLTLFENRRDKTFRDSILSSN